MEEEVEHARKQRQELDAGSAEHIQLLKAELQVHILKRQLYAVILT